MEACNSNYVINDVTENRDVIQKVMGAVGAIPIVNNIMLQYKYMQFKKEMTNAGGDAFLISAAIRKMDAYIINSKAHPKVRKVLNVVLFPFGAISFLHNKTIEKKIHGIKRTAFKNIMNDKMDESRQKCENDKKNYKKEDQPFQGRFACFNATPESVQTRNAIRISTFSDEVIHKLTHNPRYWPEDYELKSLIVPVEGH